MIKVVSFKRISDSKFAKRLIFEQESCWEQAGWLGFGWLEFLDLEFLKLVARRENLSCCPLPSVGLSAALAVPSHPGWTWWKQRHQHRW